MNMPLEITFHGVPGSPALRDTVTNCATKLEHLAPDAISCWITVENENRRHHQGNFYRVHARLLLPHAELDAERSSRASMGYTDPYVAVRDTFDALVRRLEEHIQRQRGEIEYHYMEPRNGRILELYPDTGYGLIRADDGREVQFHRTSLARGRSADLKIGREVRFIEVPSNNGAWAGNVQPSAE